MDHLDLECLRVYDDKKRFSKYSFKRLVELFTPPIFSLVINKVKSK